MAIIDRYRDICTVFEKFTVEPEDLTVFISEFSQFIKTSMGGCQGFISVNLHYCESEKVVMNYSQWKSDADYDAFRESPEIMTEREKFYKQVKEVTKTKVVLAT